MDTPYIVYTSKTCGGGTCHANSDLIIYLNAEIEKFNYKYKKKIGFYSTERLEGENLKAAREIIYKELNDLVENYHVDANPKGFGRSALRKMILGQERILNHFSCKIDQIIFSLQNLLEYFNEIILKNETIIIYGLGDIDVFDCNIVWAAKKLTRSNEKCSILKLEDEIAYIFKTENIIKKNPNIFYDRLEKLQKNGFLTVENNNIFVTEKGQTVNVWSNYLTTRITIIDKGK